MTSLKSLLLIASISLLLQTQALANDPLQDPINEKAWQEIQPYLTRTGTLTHTADGQPSWDQGQSCEVTARFSANPGEYLNETEVKLAGVSFSVASINSLRGKGISQRTEDTEAQAIIYQNKFDKLMGVAMIGGANCGTSGPGGHFSNTLYGKVNRLTLSAAALEISVTYRCGLFGGDHHSAIWSCKY